MVFPHHAEEDSLCVNPVVREFTKSSAGFETLSVFPGPSEFFLSDAPRALLRIFPFSCVCPGAFPGPLNKSPSSPTPVLVCFAFKAFAAALKAAMRAKAPALEAYPLDATLTPSASFTGYASTFARAGFKVVARRVPPRPIMRHDLGNNVR